MAADLNDMVFKADAFFLLSASVFYVEDTDEVRRPASDYAVEDLEHDARQHTQLGK